VLNLDLHLFFIILSHALSSLQFIKAEIYQSDSRPIVAQLLIFSLFLFTLKNRNKQNRTIVGLMYFWLYYYSIIYLLYI